MARFWRELAEGAKRFDDGVSGHGVSWWAAWEVQANVNRVLVALGQDGTQSAVCRNYPICNAGGFVPVDLSF